MSKVCEFCGKHAPNIQRVTVVVDGHRRKANVCSRCLKSGKIARS